MTWILPSALSHSAPASADSTSVSLEHSGFDPWLTLNGTATQRPCSWNGWKRRPWSRRLFGSATSPTWTPDLCGDTLTSCAPGTPASRSRRRGAEQEQQTLATCGPRLSRPFAHRVPALLSWRMSADMFSGDSTTFSGIWPTSGSMRSGACFERAKLVRHTHGPACSSLPTPTAQAYGSNCGGGSGRVGRVRHSLETQARADGGHPNPHHWQWMLGLPRGWTSAAASATPSSHSKPNSPSENSSGG